KVDATDSDVGENAMVRYELFRGTGEFFTVDRNTGEIIVKQLLNEAKNSYHLTVAAYDGGKPPLTSQIQVYIRVVSAKTPVFIVPVYYAFMNENDSIGTHVVQ
ncbi:unnamed protein product, partial [Meganyctiphanes norvegica]